MSVRVAEGRQPHGDAACAARLALPVALRRRQCLETGAQGRVVLQRTSVVGLLTAKFHALIVPAVAADQARQRWKARCAVPFAGRYDVP